MRTKRNTTEETLNVYNRKRYKRRDKEVMVRRKNKQWKINHRNRFELIIYAFPFCQSSFYCF